MESSTTAFYARSQKRHASSSRAIRDLASPTPKPWRMATDARAEVEPHPASPAGRADRRGARRRHRRGYLAACLARLAKRVTSIDIFPDFATAAAPKLAACGIHNVELKTGDALSAPYRSQFDAIAVTASVPTPTLVDQFVAMLRPQGRLFIVVGREPAMEAQLVTLLPNGTTTTDGLFETVLAPLINSERPEPFVL
jgi:hypothetical protein